MSNNDITNVVNKYDGVLPFQIYAIVSSSDQINHVVRDGDYINMWSSDGAFWHVKVVE